MKSTYGIKIVRIETAARPNETPPVAEVVKDWLKVVHGEDRTVVLPTANAPPWGDGPLDKRVENAFLGVDSWPTYTEDGASPLRFRVNVKAWTGFWTQSFTGAHVTLLLLDDDGANWRARPNAFEGVVTSAVVDSVGVAAMEARWKFDSRHYEPFPVFVSHEEQLRRTGSLDTSFRWLRSMNTKLASSRGRRGGWRSPTEH